MKTLRVCLPVLLAVLLPIRGAVAAAMPCRSAGLRHESAAATLVHPAGMTAPGHVAQHCRDEALPLRKRISDETLLRYNGMLTGVFDLLADAREQVVSVTSRPSRRPWTCARRAASTPIERAARQ